RVSFGLIPPRQSDGVFELNTVLPESGGLLRLTVCFYLPRLHRWLDRALKGCGCDTAHASRSLGRDVLLRFQYGPCLKYPRCCYECLDLTIRLELDPASALLATTVRT